MTKKVLLADDGFVWIKGRANDPDTWTLQDANRCDVANIYHIDPSSFCPSRGMHWEALTDAGQIIGSYDTSREALAAVDNECRPCAYPLPDSSICHTDRVMGSLFCEQHQRYAVTTPDPDQPHLWHCGCLVNDGDAHRVGCPAIQDGNRGYSSRR